MRASSYGDLKVNKIILNLIWKYQLNIDPDFSIKSNIFLGFPYMFDRTGLDIAQGIYNFYLNFSYFCTITPNDYFISKYISSSLKSFCHFGIYYIDWILCERFKFKTKFSLNLLLISLRSSGIYCTISTLFYESLQILLYSLITMTKKQE